MGNRLTPRLTPKAMAEIEEKADLTAAALTIFALVVAEWKSDPTSVQCFNLRVVELAKQIDAQLRNLDPFYL